MFPAYIHHPDTGEWDECCTKMSLNKKLGVMSSLFGGPRFFYRCSPLIAEMRQYQGGFPSHSCGLMTVCSSPRQVCLQPRRLTQHVNFLKEQLGADTRNICLD